MDLTRRGRGQERKAGAPPQVLDAARVAHLFRMAVPAYVASPVYGVLLIFVLWDASTATVLAAWFACMLTMSLVRAAIHRSFLRAGNRDAAAWERRFALGSLLAGAVWSAAPMLFFSSAATVGQMAIIFVIGGALIGAAGLYAASQAAFFSFLVLPMAASIYVLAAQPGESYRMMAVMLLLFAVILYLVFTQQRGSVLAALRTRLENESLLAAYQALLAEETVVLDILPVGIAFVEQRTIVRCNHRLEQMLGYAPGELVGKQTRALYGSDKSWATVGLNTYTRLRSGGIVEDDTRLVRKDGTALWCRNLGRALDAGNPEAAAIFAFSDAQDRRAAETALRQSEAMYRNLVETSNDLIWSCDREGRWTYLNAAAVRRIWGGEPADRLGQVFWGSLAQEVRERDLAVFRRILEGEHVHNYETRHLRRDGTAVDLSFNAIPLRSPLGEVVGATGTARDITEAKKAAVALYESVERLRLAVDAADLYYWEWDVVSDKLVWGRDPAGLLGPPDGPTQEYPDFRALVHPDDRDRYLGEGRRVLESGEPYFCEFRVVAHDGRIRWLAARGRVLYGEEGAAARMIGVSQDVTERKRQEDEVRYLAYHDTLTGLPNRRLLDDRLQQVVFMAQRRDTKVAVLLIDLDRFKAVNDSLGHEAGDAVLREVANRLMGCVRKADTLARQGGDEFVIVIPELAAETDCAVVAAKILRSLAHEVRVGERTFIIGASIGISVFPGDAGDGEGLLRNADVAMYRAKELGGSNYRFYAG